MGKAPEPYYDPLAFAIKEAHKRGLQLHAWLNPYRARYHTTLSAASPKHISNTHPELVRKYGKHLWLDPGEPAVRDYTIEVVLDVVRRYDVDGIHFDDYFYPYPEQDEEGNDYEFDDAASYEKYIESGGTLEISDWRRENVDTVVRRLSESIKNEKPHVMFGISPFGIWRPGYPEGIEGFDQYDRMWADPKKWLQEGLVDYLAPQLYWPTFQAPQDYEKLLRWWLKENTGGRLLLVGNATYRVVDEPWQWGVEEYRKQMDLACELKADGNIHYFLGVLNKNPELVKMLKEEFYQQPAALPEMSWMKE
jgi:uncharacterized lipoprotein YddW (UPF0748 family)